MTDVTKGFMYEGPVMVAAVNKLKFPDQAIMLIQCEYRKGSKCAF